MTEWKVLWCLLYHPHTHLIIKQIHEEHFSTESSRAVFLLCKSLLEKGYKLEKALITSQHPEAEDNLEAVDTNNYQAYIDQLDSELFNRAVKGFSYDLQSKEKLEKSYFIDNVNTLIQKYVRHRGDNNVFDIKDFIDDYCDKLDRPLDGVDGVSTYVGELDNKLMGLKPGDYAVIAARPSMGKSALGCWIAMKNALNGVPTIFFSLEMSKELLLGRMFASETRIPAWKFKKRQFTLDDKKKIKDTQDRFREMSLAIDETSGISIEQIEATIAEKSSQLDLGLIIVDYVQIMSGHTDDENQRLTRISARFKYIAKKYKLPIIVLSQLNRLVEQRDDKRPMLSDLRGSGSLEQDADVVMMLYRDFYYNYNPDTRNLLQILIRKFREGEVGNVMQEYNLDHQYIADIKEGSDLFREAQKLAQHS